MASISANGNLTRQAGINSTPFAINDQMRTLLNLAFSLCCIAPAAYATSIKVTCEAEYGGKTERIKILPSSDVFAFHSVDVGSRFRFLAQYLEPQSKLKTFVYELRERSPALIHAAEHQLTPNLCARPPHDFGFNKLYSSDLEREMFFRCTADCE